MGCLCALILEIMIICLAKLHLRSVEIFNSVKDPFIDWRLKCQRNLMLTR